MDITPSASESQRGSDPCGWGKTLRLSGRMGEANREGDCVLM